MVTYQSGKKNNKTDALTRRPNEQPISDEDEKQEHRMQILLPPDYIEIQLIKITNKTKEETEELGKLHTAEPPAEPQQAKPEEGTKATCDKSVEAKHEEFKKKN